VNALYGGYLCGWYLLLGAGFVYWLTDPGHRESWWMIAFGFFAYFLVIPCLLFQLVPVFGKLSVRAEPAIEEGIARGALSRRYAFAVGLVGSLVAMVMCAVGYGVAAMESPEVPLGQHDDTGLAVTFFSLLMGVLAIIAACPWLGQLLLLRKCRLQEPAARRAWAWRFVPLALAIAWVGTVGWLGYRLVNATTVMTARLDFAALPASDQPLEDWLRSQPGVLTAAVRRQGNTVVVEWALCAARSHSFSSWGHTVLLKYATPGGAKRSINLTRAAADAGYKGFSKVKFEGSKRQW
jgi:hypothetical protein